MSTLMMAPVQAILLLLACMITAETTAVQPLAQFANSYYQILNDGAAMTYFEAAGVIEALSPQPLEGESVKGHIVSIGSAAEEEFLLAYLEQQGFDAASTWWLEPYEIAEGEYTSFAGMCPRQGNDVISSSLVPWLMPPHIFHSSRASTQQPLPTAKPDSESTYEPQILFLHMSLSLWWVTCLATTTNTTTIGTNIIMAMTTTTTTTKPVQQQQQQQRFLRLKGPEYGQTLAEVGVYNNWAANEPDDADINDCVYFNSAGEW